MTYSNTIPLPATAADVDQDPLYRAWLLLKEARCVPYDARDPHAWRTRSLNLVREARQDTNEHARSAEGPGSPIAWLAGNGGVAGGILRTQFAEHEHLLAALESLEGELTSTATPSLNMVVSVSERVVELEIAVARHQNRLGSLLARHGMAAVAGRPVPEPGVAPRRS